MDVYFFNWTNPEDLKNHSTKPILEELGPYRFTERPEKVDIVWHDENATVSYRKKSVYFFDEEGSNGSLDDVISSINVVALVSTHPECLPLGDQFRSRVLASVEIANLIE